MTEVVRRKSRKGLSLRWRPGSRHKLIGRCCDGKESLVTRQPHSRRSEGARARAQGGTDTGIRRAGGGKGSGKGGGWSLGTPEGAGPAVEWARLAAILAGPGDTTLAESREGQVLRGGRGQRGGA